MTLPGQTIIGPGCAWCERAAEGEIEVEPARAGTKAKGYRDARTARTVPACREHLAVQLGEPLKRRGRRNALKGQLEMFCA
jgi:hypothetical protein